MRNEVSTRAPDEEVATWAKWTAKRILDGAEPRLTHVLAVGRKAETVSLGSVGRLLVAAAYLHDIGYAPELRETGLHQIDGARWLVRQGHPDLASLVAHHTCADVEMELRGVPYPPGPVPPSSRGLV